VSARHTLATHRGSAVACRFTRRLLSPRQPRAGSTRPRRAGSWKARMLARQLPRPRRRQHSRRRRSSALAGAPPPPPCLHTGNAAGLWMYGHHRPAFLCHVEVTRLDLLKFQCCRCSPRCGMALGPLQAKKHAVVLWAVRADLASAQQGFQFLRCAAARHTSAQAEVRSTGCPADSPETQFHTLAPLLPRCITAGRPRRAPSPARRPGPTCLGFRVLAGKSFSTFVATNTGRPREARGRSRCRGAGGRRSRRSGAPPPAEGGGCMRAGGTLLRAAMCLVNSQRLAATGSWLAG